METEIWMPVKGASKYLVSNLSRIKSVERIDNYNRRHKERILIKSKGNPYDLVTIYDDMGNKKPMSVYLIVFWSFNANVEKVKGFEVDHIDEDPTNDKLDNLQYITCRHNSIKRSLSKNKTSKYIGVSICDRINTPFAAHIRINKDGKSKTVLLGRFTDEIKASEAYQKALHAVNNSYFTKDLISGFKICSIKKQKI